MKLLFLRLATAAALAACAPTQVNIAPIKVQPIHMTIDVNLHDAPQPPQKTISQTARRSAP
jgi:hypothetical protein